MGKEILTFGDIEIEKVDVDVDTEKGCRYRESISI